MKKIILIALATITSLSVNARTISPNGIQYDFSHYQPQYDFSADTTRYHLGDTKPRYDFSQYKAQYDFSVDMPQYLFLR